MARRFLGSTNNLAVADRAGIQNALATGSALSIVAGFRLNASTDAQTLMGKGNPTRGWIVSLNQMAAGELHLRLVAYQSGFGTRFDKYCGVAGGAGALTVGTQYVTLITCTDAGAITFGLGTMDGTPLASVSATGSNGGAPTTGGCSPDAGTPLQIGWADMLAIGGLTTDLGISWAVVLKRATPLSLTEGTEVQVAGLALLASETARTAGDTAGALALRARAMAIVNRLSPVGASFVYLRDDGTTFDLVLDVTGATSAGTLTGSTAGQTADEPRMVLETGTTCEDDAEQYASALQTDCGYTRTGDPRMIVRGSNAYKRFSGSFTSAKCWSYCNFNPAADNRSLQATGWTHHLNDGTGTKVAHTVQGYVASTVTLSAGSKTWGVRDDGRKTNGQNSTAPGGTGAGWPQHRCGVEFVSFDTTATAIAPRTFTRRVLMATDSVGGGAWSSPNMNGPVQRLLTHTGTGGNIASAYDQVLLWAAGGMAFYDIAQTANRRTAFVAMVVAANPKALIIQLGANDKIAAYWAPTGASSFTTAYTALITALLASAWRGRIICGGLYIQGAANEASGNVLSASYTNDTYRSAIAAVVSAAASPRVVYMDIKNVLVATDLMSTDSDGQQHYSYASTTGQDKTLNTTTGWTAPASWNGTDGVYQAYLKDAPELVISPVTLRRRRTA